jgi:hypothetical protein
VPNDQRSRVIVGRAAGAPDNDQRSRVIVGRAAGAPDDKPR